MTAPYYITATGYMKLLSDIFQTDLLMKMMVVFLCCCIFRGREWYVLNQMINAFRKSISINDKYSALRIVIIF